MPRNYDYTGFMPWRTDAPRAEEIFQWNYVKIVGAELMPADDCDTLVFTVLVNWTPRKAPSRLSTLSVVTTAPIAVWGIANETDVRRVWREFEVQACRMVNTTKAKAPNFRKMFDRIDLRRILWGHWFPED